MPASMVKTKRDEKLWDRAKDRAAAEGHEGDWPYVVGIFQRMKKGAKKIAKAYADRIRAAAKGAPLSQRGRLLDPLQDALRDAVERMSGP